MCQFFNHVDYFILLWQLNQQLLPRQIGSSNCLDKNVTALNFLCFLYYKVYIDYAYCFSGYCSPRDIWIPRISVLLCITVWCWVMPNTMMSNDFTAVHFPQTLSRQSLLGHGHDQAARYRQWRLCHVARYCLVCSDFASVLSICYDWQCLTLDPSPSNAHLYRRWKQTTTILRMVIVSIMFIEVMIRIIRINIFQAGWNLLVPGSYTSSITRNQFSTSSPLVIPVVDTGTIPHSMCNLFPGAPGDCREGSGDGCGMWFVNSWALGWSHDT